MKKCLPLTLTLLLLFSLGVCTLPSASGDETYANGYVNNDGYTFKDNYWYYGGVPYTRQKEYYTYQSYPYGPYYQSYRYRYYEYQYPAKAQSYSLPSYNDPGWRAKLLDIAKYRDEITGKMRQSALEHQAYLESVRALGLENNFAWQGYGQAPAYPNAGYGQPGLANYNLGNYGANANTIYGYKQETMASIYGTTDMSILYQQAGKLTENAQELASNAYSQFGGLVKEEGLNRSRVAEILAKGQAAAAALTAAEGQSVNIKQTTETYGTQAEGTVNPNGGGVIQPPILPRIPVPGHQHPQPPRQVDYDKLRDAVMNHYCYACHNQKDKAGKLDLTIGYAALPEDDKDLVWERLITPDPAKRMPQALKGGKAPELAPDELQLFRRNLKKQLPDGV